MPPALELSIAVWSTTISIPISEIPDYPERVIHYGSFYGEFFFNFVFAATATTITSGSVVERSRLAAYLIYSFFLTGFVQPVTVHWTWSNGFLLYPPKAFKLPPDVYFRDYAGRILFFISFHFIIL